MDSVSPNKLESEMSSAWREGDIVFYLFKKSKIDLPEAEDAIEKTVQLSIDAPEAFCIDISNVRGISKEARVYLTTTNLPGKKNNVGTALIAPNILSKLIGTFALAFNDPGVKAKLFTDREEAIKWLKKNLKEATK